jgi:hypothetical protein
MSEIGTPASVFLPHYVWLGSGMTDVEIQAALNDPWIYGVFLDPAGTYALAATVTVPAGKFLEGAGLDPDPDGATRAILTLSPGAVVAVFGQFKYCNVVWDSTSPSAAVAGTSGSCEHVHVSVNTGASSTAFAFEGSFWSVVRCSCLEMSGVNLTQNPGVVLNRFWTRIEDCQFQISAGAGSFGVQMTTNTVDHVRISGLKDYGHDYGIIGNVFGTNDLWIEDCEFRDIITRAVDLLGTVSAHLSDIRVVTCADGIWIEQVGELEIQRIQVSNASGEGIHLQSCYNSLVSDLSVGSGTGLVGVNLFNLVDANVNGVTCTDQINGVGPSACIVIDRGVGGIYNNLTAKNSHGNVQANGINISACSESTFTGLSAFDCDGVGIYGDGNVTSSFSGLTATRNETGIFLIGNDIASFSTMATYVNVRWGINLESNTNCTFGTMTANGNGRDGVYTKTNADCTFTTIASSGNGVFGMMSDSNSFCSFSAITANGNGSNGIETGNESYDNWSNVSCSNNTGLGFNGGVAPAAACNLDGLFTRGNGLGSSTLVAPWIFANLVAV